MMRSGGPGLVHDPVSLAALIAAITALAFWLERRFTWASRLGAALVVIFLGAVLSNLGLVAPRSSVYETIFGPVTSLAIVWMLFAVRLEDLRQAGPRMLGAFGLAVVATAIGATVATLVFSASIGPDTWKLAGVMTGTYSGGGLNFVAVGRELELPASLFSAAAAADNLVTGIWMGATLVLPLWLGRHFARANGFSRSSGAPASGLLDAAADPLQAAEFQTADLQAAESETAKRRPLHLLVRGGRLEVFDVSVLLALGFGTLYAAAQLHVAVPAIPEVLWLTTVALVVAQLPFVRQLSGALPLGYLALHLFFAVLGIASRVADILAVGPEVLYLTALVVAIHGTILYSVARLVKLDVATTSVASQAAVGGPSSALALAMSRGWDRLALPGIAAGLLGYAAGNYAGFGIAYLVRSLLGG